jgi:hypothetical protein
MDPALWLQDTAHEHARSAFAGRACTACHMPRGERDPHALPGHTDPAMLARSLRVEGSARRIGRGTRVVLAIHGDVVGHAVPTGDVYRELVVRAWPEGHPADATIVVLGRTLAPAIDTRVPPTGTREVVLDLRGRVARAAWDITLRALPPDHERARGLSTDARRWAVAHGEIETAR